MLINVEQKHIDNGAANKCSISDCMMALAINDAFNDKVFTACGVSHATLIHKESNTKIHVELPREAVLKIIDFAEGKPVEPFSYELDVPPGFQALTRK